jgi:lactoylglutathione lyase
VEIRPVPVKGLFETPLTVTNPQSSITFYKDIVGLELGLEVPDQNCVFFWIEESKHSMLGLWPIGTMPLE